MLVVYDIIKIYNRQPSSTFLYRVLISTDDPPPRGRSRQCTSSENTPSRGGSVQSTRTVLVLDDPDLANPALQLDETKKNIPDETPATTRLLAQDIQIGFVYYGVYHLNAYTILHYA